MAIELTAIIFFKDRQYAIKYRKISSIDRFVLFVKKKYPNCASVNFYDKETKQFFKQVKM